MDSKDIAFSELLGVDPNKISQTCAEFSTMALFDVLSKNDELTPEKLIGFIRDKFTENERVFLVLTQLMQDTVTGAEKLKHSPLIEIIIAAQRSQKTRENN